MAGKVSVENDGSVTQESSQKELNSVANDQQIHIGNGGHEVDSAASDSSSPTSPVGNEREASSEDANNTSMEATGNGVDGATAVCAEGTTEEMLQHSDVVVIQDTGFMVEVAAPGLEPFELQVSSMELVQEIHQVLMDREDTCHRTCFSLQLDGVTLDNFAELKSVEGLQEGSVIKVIEEPYTAREARIHVRHVRDLLKSLDPADAYNGQEGMSLCFLNTVTNGDILEKKKVRPESVDCTPPDYIIPDSKERPLTPLHPICKDTKVSPCLKVLTLSGWNPPPGPRKMHGDLMYLYVITMEDKRYHLTASTKGFYVNQSTEEGFNPKAAQPKHLSHSLIDLMSQISPTFKRNFTTLQRKRVQRHPFERVATPYQVFSWVAPVMEHTIDSIRAEDAFSSKLGYEEHIPGQTRDWNEELQTTRELARTNIAERLLRERAIFKVHSDFVAAATRGAMAVIDGNVMAINPGEDAKMQLFIWNNIFFSLGFDVKDHYKELGGDAAAYVAPGNDLQGVKAYWSVDLEGLYTLGTVVVDYRGYRVTAQSIIPGILEREQEQSVVYGSIDFGKTVVASEKYVQLLSKTAKQLKIKPHKVLNEKGEEVLLCSSIECKGIVGNDQRYYILDLLRTFPPDVNYLPVPEIEYSAEAKRLGYPKEHKHKLCCLRQELVDAFVDARYLLFLKHAAYHLQQLRAKRQEKEGSQPKEDKAKEEEKAEEKEPTKTAEEEEGGEAEKPIVEPDVICNGHGTETKDKDLDGVLCNGHQPAAAAGAAESKSDEPLVTEEDKKMVEAVVESASQDSLEDNTKEIVRKAAEAVGSLKDTEFDIRFNPDVFSPGIRFVDDDGELKKEQNLVKEASEFLITHQIPSLVRYCLEHTSSPIDGETLSDFMQIRGINMRYLGKIADMLAKISQLEYVYTIAVCEMLSRSVKHVFKVYMQGVEQMSLAGAVSHFINCFLGSYAAPHASPPEDLQSKHARRKNKRNIARNKHTTFVSNDNTEWVHYTPKTLWQQIVGEVESYFDFSLGCDNIDAAIEKYSMQKVSLLHSFCVKCGVQILLREFNMDSKHKQAFGEDDIVNLFPIVKHVQPKATDAHDFYNTGQAKIQQGFLKEGYELISEALNLLNNVYGAMHPEICTCLRLLARLNYIMGDYPEALAQQQKAVLMSERVLGVDHPNTITEYTHLAQYCFANSHISTALKLLYRARYLALLLHGENHPEIALLDSNIGLILHAVGEHDLALRFLEKSLQLNTKYYGAISMKVAISYHLRARVQSCRGDFRGAIQSEKETFGIYKAQLGEEHDKTRESSDCLRHLTQQAVVLQKKMNEIYKGGALNQFPPLQVSSPTMAGVLDLLNIINGILFVQFSQKDIELFRRELDRRQGGDTELEAMEEKAADPAMADDAVKVKVGDHVENGVAAETAAAAAAEEVVRQPVVEEMASR